MKRDSRVRASLGAMPHMLVALDWDTVKQFFLREVPRLF